MFGRRIIAPVVLVGILSIACASDDAGTTTAAGTSVAPTTITADVRSSAAAVAMTTDPRTETTVPDPTTTSTTTTTTTTVPVALPRVDELTVDPIFEPILEHLAARTAIPLRLPAQAGFGDDGEIVPTLWSASEDHYIVYLGFGTNCSGGNACRVATFTGRRQAPPTIETGSQPPGVPVELPGIIADGALFDSTCGANCSDAMIRWSEDGVVYTVGQKAASGPTVLTWAWSAIDADRVPPTPPELCGPGAAADAGRVARIITTGATRWLAVCSDDGIAAEIVESDGALRWFDLDGDGDRDLVLALADGTSRLFSVSGIHARPVMDNETFARLVVGDLRCDMSGGRTPMLYDARTGELLELVNPGLVSRLPATPPTNDVCA